MEDTPFGKTLHEAMVRAKIKPSTLARELRVSRATIYKWLSGQLPSRKHARFLQSRLGLTDSDVSNVMAAPPSTMARRVPLMETMPATGQYLGYVIDITQQNWLEADVEFSTQAIGLRLPDDSMEPEFFKGEIVIVDPQVKPRDGDYVVAEFTQANEPNRSLWTFKQYRARGHYGGQQVYDLVPLNPTYSTMTVGPDFPGRIIGTLVEHRRRPQLKNLIS